ncbi:hypothetical protein ACFQ12_20225, partial [Methylobacterium trifolii]
MTAATRDALKLSLTLTFEILVRIKERLAPLDRKDTAMMVSVLASVPLTPHQEAALMAAAEHGGALFDPAIPLASEASRSLCEGLARAGMLHRAPPFAITGVGRQVLTAHAEAR